MAPNRGKKFEQQFKKDWVAAFPQSFILRLPDQQSGYFGTSKNLCDFICFTNKTLFLIECKTVRGNTFPISSLTQLDYLSSMIAEDIIPGVVIWFYEKDKVLFVPIKEVMLMRQNNLKSVNIKMLNDSTYKIIDIPSVKLKTFMRSDYTILSEVELNGIS